MVEAVATARGVRTSAQKAGLVCELIRGKGVNQALAVLQFTRKTIARDIAKVLRSAVANLQQADGFSGDVERLYVNACYANQGPSQKRIRPAPMGRAFRVVKRTAHLTVQVAERPSAVVESVEAEAPETGSATPTSKKTAAPKRARGAKSKPKAKAKGAARKTRGARKTAGGARKGAGKTAKSGS